MRRIELGQYLKETTVALQKAVPDEEIRKVKFDVAVFLTDEGKLEVIQDEDGRACWNRIQFFMAVEEDPEHMEDRLRRLNERLRRKGLID